MAIWPFNRKSKKSSPSAERTAMGSDRNRPPELAATTEATQQSAFARKLSGKGSEKGSRTSSRRLSKSNAPSARESEKAESIPPVPPIPKGQLNELNEKAGPMSSGQHVAEPPRDRGDIPSYYFQNPMSSSSLQPEKFSVIQGPPTLHSKKSASEQGIMRRKSSKRKKEDQVREREIKAMTAPIPIPKRPKSYQTDILARDSRNIPGDLNRNLDRPFSNVSLPLAESLHSQMSTSFEHHRAFKVSSFDALAPRPTIRYSGAPLSPSGSTGPSRASTRKDKQPVIPESDEPLEKSKKRINELADDMDATSLRELMDRDRKRHEKRRKSENERLQRRLERKAERQRQQEEAPEGKLEHTSPTKPTVALVTEQNAPPLEPSTTPGRDKGTRTPESWLKDPSRENLAVEDPFHDPVAGASRSHLEEATPTTEEHEEPILEIAKAIRLSSASMTPPLSPSKQIHDPRHTHEPSSLSQYSELAPSSTPDIPETPDATQRDDTKPGMRLSSGWKSMFRRSDTRTKRGSSDRGRPQQGRTIPSEFSNTSRESVGAQMARSNFPRLPPVRSGTPIRTQSIFREDLPDFSISPSGSRVHSPENAEHVALPNIPGSRGTDVVTGGEKPLSEIHPAYREEVALSRNASLRAKSPDEPQSATLSESLASVDAEGSWLTGRPVKRLSTPQPLRESQRMEDNDLSDDDGGPGTPPAEKYMGSITPAPLPRPKEESAPEIPPRKRPPRIDDKDTDVLHSARNNLSNEEGTTWHSAPGRHPTIVRPSGPGLRMRSREGLLNDFQAAEPGSSLTVDESVGDSSRSPSEHSPSSPEGPMIQRATSVDLGKSHARHISAGSAKLLNLPPRSSTEIKRLSSGSAGSFGGERSPLGPNSRVAEEPNEGRHDDDVD